MIAPRVLWNRRFSHWLIGPNKRIFQCFIIYQLSVHHCFVKDDPWPRILLPRNQEYTEKVAKKAYFTMETFFVQMETEMFIKSLGRWLSWWPAWCKRLGPEVKSPCEKPGVVLSSATSGLVKRYGDLVKTMRFRYQVRGLVSKYKTKSDWRRHWQWSLAFPSTPCSRARAIPHPHHVYLLQLDEVNTGEQMSLRSDDFLPAGCNTICFILFCVCELLWW